jgi:single-strand DNA-binding protein
MNKVIIIGRLTKDPDIKYTQSGKVVCTFTLAVDRPYLNQDGVREADFIPVVLWGKTAEIAGNSCAKGHRLCVEGRIQVRTYEDKNNKKVWVTEVVGDHIEFLERKGNTAASQTSADSAPTTQPPAMAGLGKEVPFDDTIPF